MRQSIRTHLLDDYSLNDLSHPLLRDIIEGCEVPGCWIRKPSLSPAGLSSAFSLIPKVINSSLRKNTNTGLLVLRA